MYGYDYEFALVVIVYLSVACLGLAFVAAWFGWE